MTEELGFAFHAMAGASQVPGGYLAAPTLVTVRIRPGELHAWHGGSLLVTDFRGTCGDLPLSGFYFREARHLSRCRLLICGEAPWLCEATSVSPTELQFEYVYPEVANYGGGGSGQSGDDVSRNERGIPQRALIVHLGYEIVHGRLRIRAAVSNRSRERVACDISFELDADFADIQEAQGSTREQTAPVKVETSDGAVLFSYAHPQLPYATRVTASPPAGWDSAAHRLVVPAELAPGEETWLQLDVEPQGYPARATLHAERERYLARWREAFTRIAAPGNRMFEAVVAANVGDLSSFPLLDGPADEWLAPQAGVPLYPAFFGRDGLTAGWQAGIIDSCSMLDAVLTRLARRQSSRMDDWHDEEPGRIPYQMRTGPLAVLGLNPYEAYYADYASPLMYVIALANLYAWTGDLRRVDRHWDAARRILDWARERGDRDGDGYLEYQTRSSKGTKNQGWKDSGDAIVYDDGTVVPTPIATCELQGYWYAAQQLMAILCAAKGHIRESRAYLAAASALKERFNRDWWSERERCIGLAMDPEKRLIEAPSSNAGHCLATGIVDRTHLDALVGRLFAPDMFSGWGVRTLSSAHGFYDPLSYHRGSVWAVEQATILFGLRRFGFNARAHDLAEALFDLAVLYPEYRIPETIGGHARRDRPAPGAYPQANAPQLWNASSFPLVVQSLLGIVPWAASGVVVVDPVLPPWLPDLLVHDLQVGDKRVTLRFVRRSDGSSDFDVVHRDRGVHVVRQPPPESGSAGVSDRISALVDTLFRRV
jgi:glycogen debranching enzyme